MRRGMFMVLAVLTCVGASPAADKGGDEPLLAKALSGYVAGAPVSCIAQFRSKFSTKTIGNAIVYKFFNGQVYVNHTSGGCASSGLSKTLVTDSTVTQICRGQIVRTVDVFSGVEGNACTLGDFIPYSRSK